jgi:hypothetical protein
MVPKRIRETPRYLETSGQHTAESDTSKGDVEVVFMDGTREVFHDIPRSDFSKWEKYHFEVYCAPSGVKLPLGPDVIRDFCTG